MTNNHFKDPFTRFKFRTIEILGLILFLVACYKVIDAELHVGQFIKQLLSP